MYTVYVHIAPNNKKYFGITSTDIKHRWYSGGSGYKSQRLFWRAIQKYGWDNFQHIILAENLSKDWACMLEQLLIKKYETTNPNYGYNIYAGGEVGPKGFKFPKEFGENISKRQLGTRVSEETRKKMSEAHKGKPHSEEHNRKVALANRGRKLTAEHRQKLSIAHLGQVHSKESLVQQGQSLKEYCKNLSEEDMQKRMKPLRDATKQAVVLYQDDAFIKKFSSGRECADYLNVSPSFVCMVIKGKRNYKNYKIYKLSNNS